MTCKIVKVTSRGEVSETTFGDWGEAYGAYTIETLDGLEYGVLYIAMFDHDDSLVEMLATDNV